MILINAHASKQAEFKVCNDRSVNKWQKQTMTGFNSLYPSHWGYLIKINLLAQAQVHSSVYYNEMHIIYL